MKLHTKDTAQSIKPGDRICPDPAWNSSERKENRFGDKVEVMGVYPVDYSQTGVMLSVRTLSGRELKIDAGWFCQDEQK